MWEYRDVKSILILGSTSDIGEAIARHYLMYDYSVTLAARNLEQLNQQQSELVRLFPQKEIDSAVFDGEDFSSHASFYEQLKQRPDVVVTVMGYLGEQKVSEQSFEETQRVIHANYLGNVSILNEVANDFEKRKEGCLIGVSSVAAERGRKSNYIYGSAKAGFTAYLSGLRNRLHGVGVHVLTVHPGFVDTKMTRHLTLPHRLTASPQLVASSIYKAQHKQVNTLYVKCIWKYIMAIIRFIPEPIFKRLSL